MSTWDRVSGIGGITRDGRVITNSVVGSVNSSGVVAFLEHVLKSVAGKVIVVLDNARIHKSKLVQAFTAGHSRLEIVHTPPYQRIHGFLYAPECNPVEWLWAWVKRTELLGLPVRSVGDLRCAWRRGLARVRLRPDLVRGFFAGSALKG
jgi:putative transposase